MHYLYSYILPLTHSHVLCVIDRHVCLLVNFNCVLPLEKSLFSLSCPSCFVQIKRCLHFQTLSKAFLFISLHSVFSSNDFQLKQYLRRFICIYILFLLNTYFYSYQYFRAKLRLYRELHQLLSFQFSFEQFFPIFYRRKELKKLLLIKRDVFLHQKFSLQLKPNFLWLQRSSYQTFVALSY